MGIMEIVMAISLIFVTIFALHRINKRNHLKGKDRIVVFTKYPQPGKAKTRLIPALGEQGSCRAQIWMTRHLLKQVRPLIDAANDLLLHVFYNNGTESSMRYWLEPYCGDKGYITYSPQAGGDLGVKIASAFKNCFRTGAQKVVIVGADIPGISTALIKETLLELEKADCDMVLGKAKDGGYYLVGLHANAEQKLESLFCGGINWGTEVVFVEQMKAANEVDISVHVLSTQLEDVDYPEDLVVFERELELNKRALYQPKWSIVIPTLNEAKNIKKTIDNVLCKARKASDIEIIIVDGGSSDGTETHVRNLSADNVRLIQSPMGRGFQLAHGAAVASGDNLLFLHADTHLPKDFDIAAQACLDVPGNVGGAFKFKLDVCNDSELAEQYSNWFMWQMYLLEYLVERRVKNKQMPYGDQALFTSRKVYHEIGGFPMWYLFEDVNLVEKMQRVGQVGQAPGEGAITSAKRWQKHTWFPIIANSLFNFILYNVYKCGVSADTLAEWYYGKKAVAKARQTIK